MSLGHHVTWAPCHLGTMSLRHHVTRVLTFIGHLALETTHFAYWLYRGVWENLGMSAVCLHILISHSRVAEVPGILECYAVSYCKWFPTYRMTAISSFWAAWTLRMKAVRSFGTPRNHPPSNSSYPRTWQHVDFYVGTRVSEKPSTSIIRVSHRISHRYGNIMSQELLFLCTVYKSGLFNPLKTKTNLHYM